MIAMWPHVHVWESGGVKRTLTTVESAAEFLAEKWPEEHLSSAYRLIAMETAIELLERGGKPWAFRTLLEHAADEAGILAPRDPEPEKILPAHVARPWDMPWAKKKRRR
jgi:hypothetical protein